MEQIEKLKAELEQVQKELTWYCSKSWKKGTYNNRVYHIEINELIRRKYRIINKINQLRQKYFNFSICSITIYF